MDPAAAAPEQIDTALADLHRRALDASRVVSTALDTLHRALGERPTYAPRSKRAQWPTTTSEVVALVRARGDEPAKCWAGVYTCAYLLAQYEPAAGDLADIQRQAALLGDEYVRRGGWPRFFRVQNNGGHVHSSMGCQTCNRGAPTLFGWLPEWSGRSEAEALAALGAGGDTLCTVCFPNAPVFVNGREEGMCINVTPVAGTVARYGSMLYGNCSACREYTTVTQAGIMRRHRTATAKS